MSLLPQRRDAQLRGAGRDRGSLPAYSYPRNEAFRIVLVREALAATYLAHCWAILCIASL